MAVWRRLRAIGAIAPKGGVYVLPTREDCLEAFQWLAQEVEQANGEALLMRVERFEGLDDAELVALFQQARKRDYEELDALAAQLEKPLGRRTKQPDELSRAREMLAKLRRAHAEIARIDFFDSPERGRAAARLARIAQVITPAAAAGPKVPSAAVAAYRGKRWVTRPRPHVDRLACAWLIRRFINPDAVIRYSERPESGEVAFDLSRGEFGHRGNLCTFETMAQAFGLSDPAVRALAEIVHEIDLRDGRYARPEAAGIDAVLKGWQALPDAEREAHGVALFEGLYQTLAETVLRASARKSR
ncbi:MAG TPA: chromate resistance protein ChrB domain-containing protein [bacterium]|nr:chromate resistance protein ChrB domain-containing protein [bacterium]